MLWKENNTTDWSCQILETRRPRRRLDRSKKR